eukprot:441830-Pyramimonas_sp.AAC.1
MQHVIQATGLQLTECNYTSPPEPGQFQHLATADPSAPPGRVRAFLASLEDVRRVYAALQGQTVKIGIDTVAIEVTSDIVDAAT